MVFVGILPYTIILNKYYFLLGQESQGIDIGKWSGFGGGLEQNESIQQGAAREAYEESMGFLGTAEELFFEIREQMPIIYETGYTFLIYREYDPKIIDLYSRVYKYTLSAIRGEILEGCLEKSNIMWFSKEEIISNPDLFRVPFYKSFQEL